MLSHNNPKKIFLYKVGVVISIEFTDPCSAFNKSTVDHSMFVATATWRRQEGAAVSSWDRKPKLRTACTHLKLNVHLSFNCLDTSPVWNLLLTLSLSCFFAKPRITCGASDCSNEWKLGCKNLHCSVWVLKADTTSERTEEEVKTGAVEGGKERWKKRTKQKKNPGQAKISVFLRSRVFRFYSSFPQLRDHGGKSKHCRNVIIVLH